MIKTAAKYLLGCLSVVLMGGYLWFWGSPVGVNNYINKFSIQMLMESPELITSLGFIDNSIIDFHSGKLDSYTAEADERATALLRDAREGLNGYGPEGLTGQELLSWEISAWFLDDQLRVAGHQYGGYRVNQISGVIVSLPQFLTDKHNIISEKSVDRYISRLHEFARVIDEVRVRVIDDRDHGTVPPDFIIEKALLGMHNFADDGADSNPLVSTLSSKLAALDSMTQARKDALLAEVRAVVDEKIIPGYEDMIALFDELLLISNHDAGIWRLSNGATIYRDALQSNNSTTLSAKQIHQLGLSEVARIEIDMDLILVGAGLTKGSLVERVQHLMRLPEHNFADTSEGRVAQIAYLNEINGRLMAKVSDYFINIPLQPLEIVRVPEYAQDSSPGGYYMPPALDGSVSGRFYINQKNTTDNPRWTLPTLMYHEGAPGHHFQISSAQLIDNVPFLRTVGLFSGYIEGWALYSERLAAVDMGMYDNYALGDLGRLQAEMFRAVRLVVDTGMHDKRWSREQAITYMLDKTGMTEAEVVREIERYVVWPGQATAYKVGQLAILKIRSLAERELGEKFDIKQFHEVILSNGAMPLDILESTIIDWVASQK